jgi:hypothetical protein
MGKLGFGAALDSAIGDAQLLSLKNYCPDRSRRKNFVSIDGLATTVLICLG